MVAGVGVAISATVGSGHAAPAPTPVGRPGHCLHPANISSGTPPLGPSTPKVGLQVA